MTGALFLLALSPIPVGMLVLAWLLERIDLEQRRAATGRAPSPDCGCAICRCRGTADVAPRGR